MSDASPVARFEVVTTRDGAPAMRAVFVKRCLSIEEPDSEIRILPWRPSDALGGKDTTLSEIMHPVVGARAEAEALYAVQSRLRERLCGGDEASREPLVVFDVGLGAGSNALAARRVSEALTATVDEAHRAPRRLELVSFEHDLGALELALRPENAAAFGLTGEPGEAARALLLRGHHETARTSWCLRRGDLLAMLPQETRVADIVFWDPFSPRANPDLWTVAAFTTLRAQVGPRGTLFTYAAATAVRAALLLAGFAVGLGVGTGTTRETTTAAHDPRDLARPLDDRWLLRLSRSSAPFPADAPAGAFARIAAHPQFERKA